MISGMPNLAYHCDQFGIPYIFPDSETTKMIEKSHLFGKVDDDVISITELAEFYIRAFAEENRADASDYIEPLEYIAPSITKIVESVHAD
jgi:hypothetical protein